MMLEDIANFLAANGYGVFNPTGGNSTIFAGYIPPTPFTLIALEEYQGIQDRSAMTYDSPLPQWELPRLHLSVRGEPRNYTVPRNTIEKISQLFQRTTDRPLFGATQYNRITPLGGVYSMPPDANNCRMFTANFEVMKSLSVPT